MSLSCSCAAEDEPFSVLTISLLCCSAAVFGTAFCFRYASRGNVAACRRLIMLTREAGSEFKSMFPPAAAAGSSTAGMLSASVSSLHSDCACWLACPASSLFLFRIMSVLNRLFTASHTVQVHEGLCLPFPLGGWLQTMHEHPARCLGCLVVAATSVSPCSPVVVMAAFAKVSRADASSWFDDASLLLLNSLLSRRSVSCSLGVSSSGAEHEDLPGSKRLSEHNHFGGRRVSTGRRRHLAQASH